MSSLFDRVRSKLRGKADVFCGFLEANKEAFLHLTSESSPVLLFAPLDNPYDSTFESALGSKHDCFALMAAHVSPLRLGDDGAVMHGGLVHSTLPSGASPSSWTKVCGTWIHSVVQEEDISLVFVHEPLPAMEASTDMLAEQIRNAGVYPYPSFRVLTERQGCSVRAVLVVEETGVPVHEANPWNRGNPNGLMDTYPEFVGGVPRAANPYCSSMPVVARVATFGMKTRSFLKLTTAEQGRVFLRFTLIDGAGTCLSHWDSTAFHVVGYSAALSDDVKAERHKAMKLVGKKLPAELHEAMLQQRTEKRKRDAMKAVEESGGCDVLSVFASIATSVN